MTFMPLPAIGFLIVSGENKRFHQINIGEKELQIIVSKEL